MMALFKRLLILLAALTFFGAANAHAQDAVEKSDFVKYVEEQLSTDNLKIGLNGLKGTLSSNVSFASITLSDAKGVWLTIEKPKLVWTRTALLTGKLAIKSLTAERINYIRNPAPNKALPSPEATLFILPDLPVAVIIEKLEIDRISIAQEVFGLKADASIKGRMTLDDGSLDLDLKIARLDGPGGTLSALVNFNGETKNLELDVKLQEPADGITANLLNLEGRPPVSLNVTGNAPVSKLAVKLGLDVDSRRILTGDLQINRNPQGLLADARLSGPLASILPQRHRRFFGLTSDLTAQVLVEDTGAVDVKKLNIDSGALDLKASAYRLADGFLSALQLRISMQPDDGRPIRLPTSSGDTFVTGVDLQVEYDAKNDDRWQSRLKASEMTRDTTRIASVELTANGTVTNLDNPDNRQLTFNLDGLLGGFVSQDQAINQAVGDSIKLSGNGAWQSKLPLVVSLFKISGDAFSMTASGELSELVYEGDIRLEARQLGDFAALAGRDLGGSASLSTSGSIKILTGGFDLKIDGTTTDLGVGAPAVNQLLSGVTSLSGGFARDENGLAFRELRIANRKFETNLDGRFSSKIADVAGNALIQDIATLSEQASGPLKLDFYVEGQQLPFKVRSTLSMPSGKLQKRTVEKLNLTFDGETTGKTIAGTFSGTGGLDGKAVSLSAKLDVGPELVSLTDLDAVVGATNINGDLVRAKTGLINANLKVDSSNIRDIAALALVDASGAIDGTVELLQVDQMQAAKADVRVRELRYQDYRVGSADLVASVVDLFGQPKIGGTINGNSISAGGVNVQTLNGVIGTEGKNTTFDLNAQLQQNDARIKTSGRITQSSDATEVSLKALSLTSNIADARLQGPTRIVLGRGQTRLSSAVLLVGAGSIGIDGTVSDQLDLGITVNAIPLSIINAVRPQTRAGGTVSGRIDVTGAVGDPIASFQLNGRGMDAAQLSDTGISPLSISTTGRFSDNVLRLTSMQANNAQNIDLSASGSVPLTGNGLSLRAFGTAPLSLAESVLKSRGASVSGLARFNIIATGSIASPSISGGIAVQGATVVDPLSNLKLTNIGLNANLTGDRLVISSAGASLSRGGTIVVTGSVDLGGNLPANLRIVMANAQYTDGQLFDTKASGQLTLTGPLLRDPILGGTIDLGKTEITVPESFAANADLLDVNHVRPSTKTRRTLARLKRATPVARPTSRPSILRLDIAVNAPNQIFVRGRGLDAELGGRIRITGPISNVQPAGSFELRRGRLAILGQRIDLSEGTVTLTGDLDPVIDLLATTRAGDVDAYIRLKGRVSDVDVTFSSSPELPEDEVLALIIFGKGIGDLSPAQIARLASIAAELTGGNSPGLVDGIRKGTGLDDLDIVQDDEGNAAVKAGKYINDNVYLGVEVGKKTQATINLDITDNVKARGAISSEGDTSIGIFLERDY